MGDREVKALTSQMLRWRRVLSSATLQVLSTDGSRAQSTGLPVPLAFLRSRKVSPNGRA